MTSFDHILGSHHLLRSGLSTNSRLHNLNTDASVVCKQQDDCISNILLLTIISLSLVYNESFNFDYDDERVVQLKFKKSKDEI
jgi:hypothetical protein